MKGLVEVIKPEKPNTYWEADFTYVWTGEGNAYLCAIIDGWDRDIVGDVFSDRCRAVDAAEALEKAVMRRFGRKVPEGHNCYCAIIYDYRDTNRFDHRHDFTPAKNIFRLHVLQQMQWCTFYGFEDSIFSRLRFCENIQL